MSLSRSKPWHFVILLSILSIGAFYYRHASAPVSLTISGHRANISTDEHDELTSLQLTPKPIVNYLDPSTLKHRKLHGRFLHITDLHPDPFYSVGSSPSQQCHSRDKSDDERAGKYGDAILGCDSPMILMNDTLQWIQHHLADKIDFIIWTGDNIRHDNDRRFPRTEQNIFDMNQHVSTLMQETFPDIPIIPSLGNNDVFPHNLFASGPTLQTRELFKIWRPYIPQLQLHIFNRGAYFFQEVIPGKLAVLSLNTLYLFKSNPLVDNCDDKKQPGHQLFQWLGSVLKEMRRRGMKCWLSGHVPPNEKNYDESCWRKFVVWQYEYRDVIIGGVFGHMNIDHFIPLDSHQAYKSIKNDYRIKVDLDDTDDTDDIVHHHDTHFKQSPISPFQIRNNFEVQGGVPNNKVAYMESIRESSYAKVKSKSSRYAIAHVAASVVPTFNPGLRVWEYNTSDVYSQDQSYQPWDQFLTQLDNELLNDNNSDSNENDDDMSIEKKRKHKKKSKKKKKKKIDKTFPSRMPSHLQPGPAYTHQSFTPTRYVQYYADLASINAGKKEFGYEVEYATDDAPFSMPDLTVDSWIKLARTLGAPLKKGKKSDEELAKLEDVWNHFVKFSFVSSDYEHKGYG